MSPHIHDADTRRELQANRKCKQVLPPQEEVSRHEPISALDGGPSTGVRDLLTVCSQAGAMLARGGFLGLETLGKPTASMPI